MKNAADKGDERFTYDDYLKWPDEERWELIDGRAFNMTPAPSTSHQTIVGNVNFILRTKLKNSPCRVFSSPTDVVLSEYDIVQPDVFVVCDQTKITSANIRGGPDVVFEVLSPSTILKDRREKKRSYERCGVPEYVLLHPHPRYVEHYILETDGLYGREETLGPEEILTLVTLNGLRIDLKEVFEGLL